MAVAARIVARLHDKGIVPGDLKSTNFVRTDAEADREREPLVLVDHDRVRFGVRRVSDRDRARNISQFFSNLQGVVSPNIALRFLTHYRQRTGLTRAQIRQLATRMQTWAGAEG
jgi:tRNA A-37 threonylcarbamoyl transferase component Bud32